MTPDEAERPSFELNRQQIADSPAALAERLIPPRWYYPVTGVWIGGLIAAGPHVSESLIGSLAFCVAMFAFVWLVPRVYRNAIGFSVSRPAGRRAWAWLIALMLPVVGIFIAGVALQSVWGWVGPGLAAIVTAAVVIIVGLRYDAAVHADVRRRA